MSISDAGFRIFDLIDLPFSRRRIGDEQIRKLAKCAAFGGMIERVVNV